MNWLTKKIKEHVAYMENTHVNDPKTTVLLDEIEELLQKDMTLTIKTLQQLDLLSIEWICSRFESVSYKLQSKVFVITLESLLKKFSPNINGFKEEVQEAKNAYNVN
ncbi:hypothetical protein U8527_00705 [Kordia algicida OT-1]|uniref:Uncharacterized protein n=1 Tax=Kordia algicida OT-1 TaxID=391587 RepID=A9DRL6_9FLAO|nr:hypothetical protein [Kordia algicida]EDP96812.1 hypothetical protein KAOT1_16653 [Kordia algicida OT-1]